MKETNKRKSSLLLHKASQFGLVLVFTLFGSVLIHIIVMLIDYYLVDEKLHVDLRNNFVESIFSYPMLPMMAAYALLSLAVLLIWKKLQQTIVRTHEYELKAEKNLATVHTAQQLTGILVQHISVHNAEILKTANSKQKDHKKAMKDVKSASLKIAESLRILSEASFVLPYTSPGSTELEDYVHFVESKLQGLKK